MLQAQIFLDEGDKGPNGPLYEFILRYLMKGGLKGATLYRADFGFGSRQHLHAPSRFGGLDERPIMITFIDAEEKVRAAMAHIKPLLTDGLAVTHRVDVW